MTTLQTVELGVLGPLQVRQYGLPVTIPGAKPRAILTMLGLHGGSVVSADTLVELLWGDDPPRTAVKALQTHISSLRRTLGDGFVLTEGTGWALSTTEIDASRHKLAARMGRDAIAAGDASQAVAHLDEALTLWRGIPELPDGPRGVSEKTRWIESHAAVVEDRADALLATGRAAEIVGELEAAVADAPLRERRWGQLMLALYRAGRQGEALGAYQRARSLLADELGVDPGPDLRRLEAAIVTQDAALEMSVSQQLSAVTRAVTFLLTDIEGSTAAWEADADAMAVALARHDEIVEQVVTSRGGRLIKTRGEGDATFSVFDRPSAAAAAAIELQEAILHEPWELREPMRIRVALHTGEVELRDGDYFGRAVNRAARLRSLAAGGQILCSGATAELVIDSLPDDVVLADLGMRQLRNLPRPEHVFELRLETADGSRAPTNDDAPMERPGLPAVLAGPGPFVGRGRELERLLSAWQTTLAAGTLAVLIAGEPGVGKTRLAGEWSRRAYDQGAVVLYGRCDEDLGAPYQPFAEALRSLVPCLGANRLRGLRGVEALLPLVPGLTDALPDLAAPTRADPDTERYALFDAVVALLGVASTSAPVVLILDDLHWAAKPTLLLLRHLLRFGEHARVQIVGTYRSTDLDRSHPLAAMLADLHRDGSANRLQLSGLDEDDVTAYVAEAGYDDEELARALASVTGGNPFFLIEALRHVDESGGRWDPSTLPQGVREAVSRRLSRLPAETNKALAAAAVVGSRFAVELVERVVDGDLVDAFDEACKAGIVIEEPGGRYRFNHAIVRQSLLAELASVRRMRLHQRIAATLEDEPGTDDELLAELAYHYFECAWAGNAAKAVDYCRRAADQAMARLAYEGAADLYDKALHALEELDDELPDRDDQQAELLVARCEALLAAGDVVSAAGAVSQLQAAASDSARLAAWGTCFDGQLAMLTDPERLDEIELAVGAAAEKLAGLDDAAGEAKAQTVRAACLARLGRVGDCETALDQALTAARRAGEHRRVNAVLAGAPLAALWGPNPVPRAGGRCLDVVRLLRITTGSPVVEATSTRCQGVLDAFRGRAAAGRQLIESASRSLSELGMRHALLEVDQFAGIVELVADDPASAERLLRRAYNGFRRMGLDADTAETAALLARACLALDRDAEADELCTESERLAGHALKASIAWRTVRAQLLARGGAHHEARRVAEEAVAAAERTDLLVDHGDACLALATVLGAAGDAAGARAAAERAVGLYELKGAAALAEKARRLLGTERPTAPVAPEARMEELDNACVQALRRLDSAFDREAWGELEEQVAPAVIVESRRKIVGMPRDELPSDEWVRGARVYPAIDAVRHRHVVVAVRGHRLALTRLEIGTADVSPGAPRDELLQLFGLDDDGRIALQVWFDLDDMDAAIAELDAAHARLEETHAQARQLENAASQVAERFLERFAARDWDAMAEILADGYSSDDRRRVVNAGIQQGRDAEILNMQAIDNLWITDVSTTVIATRGGRLTLMRARYFGRNQAPEAFLTEILGVIEINADDRISALIVFDPDDTDAAIAELDERYLAGEAAPYTRSWQTLMVTLGELNRHEMGPTLTGLAYGDHRRIPFAPGDYGRAIEDLWELVPDARYRATAVHELDARGTVVTLVIEGTDTHGNGLQWARVCSWVFDEARVEVYEEDDLEAALARFEQLRPQERRLENTASQVVERYLAQFAAHDWDAIAEMVADDFSIDDRRRTVNAGVRHGRDAEIEDLRAAAEVGFTNMTSAIIATRGERLMLTRFRASGRDPEAIQTDVHQVVGIDTDGKLAAVVVFDIDDIDAAFEELDARYAAGEAAAHARTWSVIAGAYAALNRHEMYSTTPNWVNIDHQQVTTMAPGDFIANVRAAWDLAPDLRIYIEAVHRLSDFGAVITHVAKGTAQRGFEAEWRVITIWIVAGDLIDRCELIDESDLDAALARFDELARPAPRLVNAASRVDERFQAYFAARDWAAMGELLADDISADDRRRVVNAGIRHGRDAKVADMRATADLGTKNGTSTVIAIRGQRLALVRIRLSGRDQRPDAFHTEMLGIAEINADNRMAARVLFDLDDIDAAFEELDARYATGEAAAHARTWSVIAGNFVAHNRREVPAVTPDVVSIDHRRVAAFAPGEGIEYIRAGWDLNQNINVYIEAVHRVSDLGSVFTWTGHGTSHEGFDAEWRGVELMTVEGGLISRVEVFDEADIDAAIARFDELSRPSRLENAASQVCERFRASFAARDWDAMTETLADDVSVEDRRRVVNAGTRHGRDAEMANMRATADIGITFMTAVVIATRGERLVLTRGDAGKDDRAEAFHTEVLALAEIDADERIAAMVSFDIDDLDAAFEELDARYLAGEAAACAHTWSVTSRAFVALNRRELPPTMPDWVNIDQRRAIAFAPGHAIPNLRAWWDLARDTKTYIEAVHQLSHLGATFTWAAYGTSEQGFDAEWRGTSILTFEGDKISRCELFDEADLDAALARFDELSRPAAQLENTASQVAERFLERFAVGDWDAIEETLADDFSSEDRRRVVGAGIRHGRDVEIASIRAGADLGGTNMTSTVIATRGERLILTRTRHSGRDQAPEAFRIDVLAVVEIDADNRIVARVVFDIDDLDAAFEELDARYLAGEAAPYAHTWGVIAHAYTVFNRRELFPTAPDWVNVDHRRGTTVAPGDLKAFIRASRADTPGVRIYIEAVHRLTEIGAIATSASRGTSQEGFDAEWREIAVTTVDDDMIGRTELFDEADLDAALARFDELNRPTLRLEKPASQVIERFRTSFAARDWDAVREIVADDFSIDDRRRTVNAGIRHGRDAEIEDLRAAAEVGFTTVMPVVIATRGGHLCLTSARYSGRDEPTETFYNDVLHIIEIDADERIAAVVVFDLDDRDAAFEELDARYVAGEAAAYSHTWSVIAEAYASVRRGELPPMTPDCVNIDHRRTAVAIAPGDLIPYLRATWELDQDIRPYIEVVHRLANRGAVITYAAYGTSPEGFDGEWREISMSIVDGDLISRCELFDDADIDAALARFDELRPQERRLENAVSRVDEHFWKYFAARDWDAITELTADDISVDDRRRVVNAGVQRGRDAHIADLRAIAEVGAENTTSTVVATRGARLALTRVRSSMRGLQPEEFSAEVLSIVEIDTNNRIAARIGFDLDNIDAAFDEMNARYLVGEAAAHSCTWSVIARTYATFNRRELPAADWVNIDHRRGTPFATSDLTAAIRAWRDLTPDSSIHIEAVHRLSDFGAVVTGTSHGTSHEGFDAEWRMLQVLTVQGDRVERSEMFDEGDLDAALARFEELQPQTPRLENAASQVIERFNAYFAARDWAAMAELLANDISTDDRRPVVNAGFGTGRDADIASIEAVADIGVTKITSTVIATRGQRLALTRAHLSGRDQRPEAFHTEALGIVEINTDNQIVARIMFDPDDMDAAFEELDARYLAGEAAAHTHTWSLMAQTYAALNRHELPATTPDWINIDHRRGASFAPDETFAYLGATWDLMPDYSMRITAVHQLSSLGAVVTHNAYGMSQEGFDAEWRLVALFTIDRDLINRCEIFDEADIDNALALFDELNRPASRLENTAVQVYERFQTHYAARDWEAMAETLANDIFTDDRRRVVGAGIQHGRDAVMNDMRAITDLGITSVTSTVIATRGDRLLLTRGRYAHRDQGPEAFGTEVLNVNEINADHRFAATVVFDADDIDGAFEELDARYLAGEAAAHSHTWSVIEQAYAALNRREIPETTADYVDIDHRPLASIESGDLKAYVRAAWDLTPDVRFYIEAVHQLSNLGAVVTYTARGTSREGFGAEWRDISFLTVEGDLINRCEIFDEADLDTALARFDELSASPRQLENAAIRARARVADAYNRRDVEGFLALAGGRYEDRRKGLRDEGAADWKFAHAVLSETPTSWRLEIEPVAIRGDRLALSRETFRDTDEVNRPITVELMTLTEVADDQLVSCTVFFDPGDINGAMDELTARWIASGEVAHPGVIEAHRRLLNVANRHDWDTFAMRSAGATYVGHRQLAVGDTIVDYISSIRMLTSLVPDLWLAPVEILSHSALGVVTYVVVKGTSTEGAPIELPLVILVLFDGDCVRRVETFDPDQRDLALARFDELSQSG